MKEKPKTSRSQELKVSWVKMVICLCVYLSFLFSVEPWTSGLAIGLCSKDVGALKLRSSPLAQIPDVQQQPLRSSTCRWVPHSND